MTLRIATFIHTLALGAAFFSLCAPRAEAQSFDVQQLRVVPNQQDNYFGQHSARILSSGRWEAGLVLDYVNDPLVVVDGDGDRVASLVGDQLSADLMLALGLFDRLELGVDLPLVLLQEGEALPAATAASGADAAFGVGDLHAMLKVQLWQTETEHSPGGTAMAIVVDAQLPTGSEDDFQGEGLRIEPRLVLDGVIPRSLRLSGQVGYLVRAADELLGTQVDDALVIGLGADLPLDHDQRFHVIGETEAKLTVLADELNTREIPLEAVFGGRYVAPVGLMVELGGGVGINHGYGTPDYRLLAGLTYRSPRAEPEDDVVDDDPDSDHDGLLDVSDKCPNQPEDRDRFEDADGCPEPDNDQDGLPDATDKCPNEPEDRDQFQDDDGCADPDNDQDGLPDTADECPTEPEDLDRFQDENGCPDPDNDQDGLLDADDSCANEPEDFDGFEDDNGCPEAGAGLVKLTCDKIVISDKVYFDTGKDTIQARSFALLEQVAGVLKAATYVKKMRIEGHTDDRGNDAGNLELSARRATAVVRFLTEHGVSAERLVAEGLGETKPIASNTRRAGRTENRRVEFVVAEQEAGCAK